jgi:hypothetical protein
MPAEPARLRPVDRDPLPDPPRLRRDPFTPPAGLPPSRPIAKEEEGASSREGLAAFGSFVLIAGLAALVAWVLYLALA